MTFRKSLGSTFLIFVLSIVTAEVTISDFSGVWRSHHNSPDVNILTSQGPAYICRDAISSECDEEITPLELTFTFNGTSVALEVRDREGITTVEEAAAAHPECAKDGIYPFERVASLPPGQITSYNATDGRAYFIDPRRPDDLNCVIFRYEIGENGPYIQVNMVAMYKGSISNVYAIGASYRCEVLQETCDIEVNEQGELHWALQDSANFTCIDGDCLYAVKAASPSASHAPIESLGDL